MCNASGIPVVDDDDEAVSDGVADVVLDTVDVVVGVGLRLGVGVAEQPLIVGIVSCSVKSWPPTTSTHEPPTKKA